MFASCNQALDLVRLQ